MLVKERKFEYFRKQPIHFKKCEQKKEQRYVGLSEKDNEEIE